MGSLIIAVVVAFLCTGAARVFYQVAQDEVDLHPATSDRLVGSCFMLGATATSAAACVMWSISCLF